MPRLMQSLQADDSAAFERAPFSARHALGTPCAFIPLPVGALSARRVGCGLIHFGGANVIPTTVANHSTRATLNAKVGLHRTLQRCATSYMSKSPTVNCRRKEGPVGGRAF